MSIDKPSRASKAKSRSVLQCRSVSGPEPQSGNWLLSYEGDLRFFLRMLARLLGLLSPMAMKAQMSPQSGSASLRRAPSTKASVP